MADLSKDLANELHEIGCLLDSGMLLFAVRRETSKVMRDGFSIKASNDNKSNYDIVVSCGENDSKVARRLRSKIADISVEHIAKGVLGIRHARRI